MPCATGSNRRRSRWRTCSFWWTTSTCLSVRYVSANRDRFGIGNEYTRGAQINFVLGEWTDEEKKKIDERLKVTTEIIPSFCLQGIDRTMNQFNNK